MIFAETTKKNMPDKYGLYFGERKFDYGGDVGTKRRLPDYYGNENRIMTHS